MRILILGGTTEATMLANALARNSAFAPVLSLAGRTQNPVLPSIPHRIGGFGGISGLRDHLVAQAFEAVIDATHPFASQMSAHAFAACQLAQIPLAIFTRPAWQRQNGDDWLEIDSITAAVAALGTAPRRVFLTHGRLQLAAFAQAPQHFYVVRTIDPPANIAMLPRHRLILARGPFTQEEETELMWEAKIDVLVTKNSGGSATYGKIAAARSLRVGIVMLGRPPASAAIAFNSLQPVLDWLAAHHTAP